jgi:hypothetical protein
LCGGNARKPSVYVGVLLYSDLNIKEERQMRRIAGMFVFIRAASLTAQTVNYTRRFICARQGT